MDFFGREDILRKLIFELQDRNVCGVFGLRKSGKTSIVKELGIRFQGEGDQRIFILRDMETLPARSEAIEKALVEDLRSTLLVPFRERGVRTHELANLLDGAGIAEFRRALQASLADCQRKRIQIVLALDEVESLVGDAMTIQKSVRPIVPEFRGCRSLVQEYDNFNVILSGITGAIVERGELYGRENPLFSWAKTFYVGAMSSTEIERLTTEIGSRMALKWSTEAHSLMLELSRGNVFLHRTLAAQVVQNLSGTSDTRAVQARDVIYATAGWKRAVSLAGFEKCSQAPADTTR